MFFAPSDVHAAFRLRARWARRKTAACNSLTSGNSRRRNQYRFRDLKKSEVDCDAIQVARMTAGARGAVAPPPVTADGRPVCGFGGVQGGGPGAPGGIQAGGIPMWQLANLLPRCVERTVVDRTGLEGYYDWQLLFSLPRAADQSGGSIFTALLGSSSDISPRHSHMSL